MGISTVKAAIKTTLTGVTGIKNIYTTAPATLPNANLPALIIFAEAGQYARTGFNQPMVEKERMYSLHLYVKPVQAGKYGKAEISVEPFFNQVAAALGNAPRLGSEAVLDAVLTGDEGISVLTYNSDVSYLGIIFQVKVENLL